MLGESGAGAGAKYRRAAARQPGSTPHIFSLMRNFGPIQGADTSQAGRSGPMMTGVTDAREARNAPRRSEQSSHLAVSHRQPGHNGYI